MTLEDLLEECGGFTKYLFLITFGIAIQKMSCGWSMLQMSYSGLIPDWHCVARGGIVNGSSYYTNQTLKVCSLNNSLTGFQEEDCQSYRFDGSHRTIITEWDLVCDWKFVKATVISIQMVGVLIGSIISGQLTGLFGRRKTQFVFCLIHSLLNFGAAFSQSWEMFAVFRFFLGVAIGAIMVGNTPYMLEFSTTEWRPMILSIFPTWPLGVAIFSLAGYLFQDWSYLHLGCGLLGLLLLLAFLIIPESVRWLALQGRFKEGIVIIEKMAAMNGKTLKSNTHDVLQKIYLQEQESRSTGRKYSYWDLFKGSKQTKITAILLYNWFMVSLVFYGISFGASSLGGNVFLNIFLLAVVELPALFSNYYFCNKLGRKRTTAMWFVLAGISSSGCIIVHFVLPSDSREVWIIAFSVIAKVGIGAGWLAMQLWTAESYPTVLRTLAYGAVSSSARIGGMCAPFIIDFDNIPKVAYALIASMLLVSVLMSMLIPETKGHVMEDSLNVPSHKTKIAVITQGEGDHHKSAHETKSAIDTRF